MGKYSDDKIINSLNKSIKTITPNIFEDIKVSIGGKKENMKKRFKWIPTTVITMVMILFIGVYYNYNFKTESLIAFDVNPSIELEVNKANKILKVNALNDGALKIVDNMDLKNVDLNVAVNALLGSMVKYGYLTGDDANILVTVQNKDEAKSIEVKKLVTDIVNKSLKNSTISATIINQTVTTSEDAIEKLANDNKISYGKALFINELIKKDATLDFNTLAPMSLREIAALIESKNINITDIVEIDEDDTTLEAIDDAIEDLNEKEDNINASDYPTTISKEDAKEIVYKHANINSSDVKNIAVKLDKEDNILVYEIDFRTDTKKYEYEINATTGAVLEFETETIKKTNTSSNTNYIGETAAKNIAYNHANIIETNIHLIKIVLDTDDGIKVYEIEFYDSTYEYSYEIDATSGTILDFEKELID